MKVNYQLILDREIEKIGASRPRLLLHSCCGPCSSYVLEYLCKYFDITVFYYNPNIYPPQEFYFRSGEQKRLIEEMGLDCAFLEGDFDEAEFYLAVRGLENTGEGGERCEKCFWLRLGKTAEYAAEHGFEYFTTTLSISPHKNARLLNETGKRAAEKYGVKYLFSDFKKRNGYKRSCELSKMYGIYRQDYCGCVFSMRERRELEQ
ncbi:MAG: epoxyqueuosine reductase QueH [Clostridiales bacterium]|nr:epoxyqueuosine reductase QueH [Clostridiales bacterium]